MSVSITALGGIGEIGMNMYVYESAESAFVLDAGVMFADYSYPGIDLIIPDMEYIRRIQHKIKGIVLSHGHEDHIGAVPYLLKEINVPVYSGRLTLGLLENKLVEHKVLCERVEVKAFETFIIGDFEITLYPVNHSISDTYGIHMRCGDFSALHVSDFKIDFTPVVSEAFNPARFAEMGNSGVTCLLSDSTNVMSPGFTSSEKSIRSDLRDLFLSAKGRVFFSTFSSNIERFRSVIDIAVESGRKVVFEGSSIVKNIRIATGLGFLNLPSQHVVTTKEARNLPDNEVCFFVTGSQGEPNSSLYRIATAERRDLQVKEGDLFIFSSLVIPGNEKNVNNVVNQIYLHGGRIAHYRAKKIHVSGHASQEELKLLLHLVKPKYFIPIHGEYIHMREHIKLACGTGLVEPENALFLDSGKRVTFENSLLTHIEDVPAGKVYVDMRGGFVFDEEMLRERKHLSRDGLVVVQGKVNALGLLDSPPQMKTVGFELTDTDMFRLRKFVSDGMEDLADQICENPDLADEFLKKLTKRFFRKTMDRRPVIVTVAWEE